MYSVKKVLFYGFLSWLFPFIAGFFLYSLHESNRVFFETLMPLVIAATGVVLGVLYLKGSPNPGAEAFKVGLIWMVISIVIDLFLFLPESPMHLSFMEYIKDIGLTYMIYPIVLLGLGRASEFKSSTSDQ
ncbi:MAG: hypothetical protein R3275_06640 [Saprospiraceae bacterium]|nr:hypothetical protein [Saprospiraceae bacterium]